jgi:hypothetical protein
MTTRIGSTEALRRFVLPALDVLTEPDEVSSIRVSVNSQGEVFAAIVFADEPFETLIWASTGDAQDEHWGLRKFASDLQDHIAESRYAWGTLRAYPGEWDDPGYSVD